MENIITFLFASINFFTFYSCVNLFLTKKFSFHREDFYGYVVIILPTFICPQFTLIAFILEQCSLLVYIKFRHKLSFFNTFVLFLLTYTLFTIDQFMLALVFRLLFLPVHHAFFPVFSSLLTLLTTLILMCRTSAGNLYKSFMDSSIPIKIIVVDSYILITIISWFAKYNHIGFYDNIIYFSLSISCLVIADFYVLYYEQRLIAQNQELVSYQKNLPIYQSLIDEIRASQHEFSNRIQHLQCLPYTCTDYNSLCEALKENTKNYKEIRNAYPLLQLNMPLLAAALYNLYCQGTNKNLFFSFDIASVNLHSKIPDYQLTDFVCILTQNAIEACMPEDTIYIRIESSSDSVRFNIRNPVNHLYTIEDIQHFFQKGVSTKSLKHGSHGFGLYHLHKSLHKLGGIIEADCFSFENQYWISFSIEI